MAGRTNKSMGVCVWERIPTRFSGLISQKLVFLGELNVSMRKTLPRKNADEFYKT